MAETFATIRGLPELKAELKRIAKEIHKKSDSPVQFGITKAANVIRDRARQLVPKRTGKTRDAIRVRLAPKRHRKAGSVIKQVYIKGREHIGYWIEYGTGEFHTGRRIKPKKSKVLFDPSTLTIFGASAAGQRPRPFMRPALNTASRRAVDAFAAGFRSKVKTLERRRARRG